MNKNIIGIIVGIIIIGGGSFYAGMSYGKNNAMTARRAGFAGGQFAGGQAGAGARGGATGGIVTGSILSKDATSMTVSLQGGGSKIVFLSDSTAIMKTASGTPDDLIVGTQVSAVGSTNSDGSISATSVQIRPAMRAAR